MIDSSFFASPISLAAGAFTGFVFGFLLQKGGVTRFNTIVKQFLLKDFTVAKVMLTAIVVGGLGIYGLLELGLIEGMHIKSTKLFGVLGGGLIFGVGMATLGYCPGTAIGAVAEGSRDAIFGLLGMLAGAWVYVEVHPWLSKNVLNIGVYGKETLPSMSGISPWWFMFALTAVAILGFVYLERWEQKVRRDQSEEAGPELSVVMESEQYSVKVEKRQMNA